MPACDAASALPMITLNNLQVIRIIRHFYGNPLVARVSGDPDELGSRRHTVAPRIVTASATHPTRQEPKPRMEVPTIHIDSDEGNLLHRAGAGNVA